MYNKFWEFLFEMTHACENDILCNFIPTRPFKLLSWFYPKTLCVCVCSWIQNEILVIKNLFFYEKESFEMRKVSDKLEFRTTFFFFFLTVEKKEEEQQKKRKNQTPRLPLYSIYFSTSISLRDGYVAVKVHSFRIDFSRF